MVLEKLGESLKNTLSKIASAVYIDEKLVNELVKDMQRALLQSDVNVKLVLDLTQKIKKRVLEEEIPSALTKKEYLINVVYEELTNFLGGEGYKINIEKKPYKIMMVGLFGNGKCVHKDTNIVLSDGQTINVEKLYNIYKGKGEVRLKDGFIVPLNDEIYVPSFNPSTLKIEKKKVSHLWKLEGKDIVEVEFDNGNNFNIKTTPEHPFFVLDKGEIKQKRADEMKTADYVAIPTNYVSEPNYFEFLSRLDKLHYDISLRKDDIVIKHFKALQQITFPKRLTPKLSEFIGYVIGDGYLSKRSVNISSEDQEIIDRIVELSQKLFSKKPSITRDKRRKKLVNIRVNSYTLVDIIHNLFGIPIGKKGRKLEMPALIQKSDLEVIRSFIRAYFDCDAYFSPKQRQIELVSESKILTKQIHHVLLRFNI